MKHAPLSLSVGAPARAAPETLAALHRAAFESVVGGPWSAAAFAASAADPLIRWVEAMDQIDDLLGFAAFRPVLDEAELLTICRAPDRHGLGLGPALMETGIAHMKKNGVNVIFLEVGERNIKALTLYASFGFELVSRRPRYYLRADGGRDDALVMRNQLSSG